MRDREEHKLIITKIPKKIENRLEDKNALNDSKVQLYGT